ncbi:hypothetical protein ACFL2G_01240 [Candidatus Omnitrophota bacterium]
MTNDKFQMSNESSIPNAKLNDLKFGIHLDFVIWNSNGGFDEKDFID